MWCIRFSPETSSYTARRFRNFLAILQHKYQNDSLQFHKNEKTGKYAKNSIHAAAEVAHNTTCGFYGHVLRAYSAYLYTVNTIYYGVSLLLCKFLSIRPRNGYDGSYIRWLTQPRAHGCVIWVPAEDQIWRKLSQSTYAQTYLDIWIKIETYKSLVFYRLARKYYKTFT